MVSRIKALALAASAAVTLAGAAPASALVINLNDIGGVAGSRAEQGFRIAARYWESVLTSDATVNINVGFNALPEGVLGGTRSALYTLVPISDYYALLNANTAKSAVDRAAVGTLPALDANGGVNVLVPGYFDKAAQTGVTGGYDNRVAPTDQAIGSTIALSSANLKALLGDPAFGADDADAQIEFSSTFDFDFDPTDGIPGGQYDFIGVAVHEIGHALGFLSGAQDFDYSAGFDDPAPTPAEPDPGTVDEFWWGYAADLFRYSKPGQLDWTFGTASYFSLNGGRSPFLDGFWSTGEENGDGWQASHWKEPGLPCENLRGIMNPYLCDGQGDDVKALDLGLLDAIGWNTSVNVAANPRYAFSTAQMFAAFADVPEPSSWALMIGGLGLVGAGMRRRRATVRFA